VARSTARRVTDHSMRRWAVQVAAPPPRLRRGRSRFRASPRRAPRVPSARCLAPRGAGGPPPPVHDLWRQRRMCCVHGGDLPAKRGGRGGRSFALVLLLPCAPRDGGLRGRHLRGGLAGSTPSAAPGDAARAAGLDTTPLPPTTAGAPPNRSPPAHPTRPPQSAHARARRPRTPAGPPAGPACPQARYPSNMGRTIRSR